MMRGAAPVNGASPAPSLDRYPVWTTAADSEKRVFWCVAERKVRRGGPLRPCGAEVFGPDAAVVQGRGDQHALNAALFESADVGHVLDAAAGHQVHGGEMLGQPCTQLLG